MEASQVTKFDTTQTGKYITKKKLWCFRWKLTTVQVYELEEICCTGIIFFQLCYLINTDIVWDIVCVYLYLSYFLSSTAHTHLKNRQKIKQHIQHQNFDVKKTFLFFC